MGKDALNPEDIYNELRRMYPGEYLPLKKKKPSLPRRGPKPTRPERMIYDHQILTPENDFQDIGRLFAEMPVRTFKITVHREQVGTKEVEEGDWFYDRDEGEEVYDTWKTEKPVYGDRIVAINVYADYERPDWQHINSAHSENVRSWEEAGRRYKEREEYNKEVKRYNNGLIHDARDSNHSRWVVTARHLKGLKSPEYLKKQKARLEEQLANVNALLGEDET